MFSFRRRMTGSQCIAQTSGKSVVRLLHPKSHKRVYYHLVQSFFFSCVLLVLIVRFAPFRLTALRLPRYQQRQTLRSPTWTRRVLHTKHSVPLRLIDPLDSIAQADLLVAVTASPRKILALHLTSGSRVARLRTIAAAIPYARATSRILLVLWDLHAGRPPVRFLHKPKVLSDCGRGIVVAAVDGLSHPQGRSDNNNDWADLNVAWLLDCFRLDDVVALAERHVYVRFDGDEGGLEGVKYASLALGVYNFRDCLAVGGWNAAGAAEDELPKSFDNDGDDADDAVPMWKRLRGEDGASSSLPSRRLRRASEAAFGSRLIPSLDNHGIWVELNRRHDIPNVMLEGLNADRRRQLLFELRRSKSGRVIFVHTQYGLGNRLRALGSALALAEETSRVLVVVWVADIHLECEFDDLFVNDDLIVMRKLSGLIWPPTEIRPYDRALSSIDFYNMMKLDGANGTAPVHDNLLVNADPREGRHMYVKTAYVVKSIFVPRILKFSSPYWARLREMLNPVVAVAKLISHPDLAGVRDCVGVHIRGRTLENDIAGLNRSAYGTGASRTDRWRRRTRVETFAAKMRRFPSRYRYFVAADTQDAIDTLRAEFGAARILSVQVNAGSCDSRSVDCVRLALADILLLAKAKALLGSRKLSLLFRKVLGKPKWRTMSRLYAF
jgi:hypothetical protein